MIVDSQLHLWTEETPERPWIPGGKQRAHLPEALTWQKALPLMDAAGIDRAIIVPPTWPGDFNDHALEAAAARPDRFAVMGRFAFEDPKSKALLPAWKQQKGMLGIRVAFNHEKTQWIVDGTADWLWQAAEEADVAVMIFAPDAPEQIGRIAEAHPQAAADHRPLRTGDARAGIQAGGAAARHHRAVRKIRKRGGETVGGAWIFQGGLSVQGYDAASQAADRGVRRRSAASGAPTSRTSAANILTGCMWSTSSRSSISCRPPTAGSSWARRS